MFSARQIADTQTQIAGLQSKLSTLQANYAALLSNTQQGALNTISVIEPAALPTVPDRPQQVGHDPAGRGYRPGRSPSARPICWNTWTIP